MDIIFLVKANIQVFTLHQFIGIRDSPKVLKIGWFQKIVYYVSYLFLSFSYFNSLNLKFHGQLSTDSEIKVQDKP